MLAIRYRRGAEVAHVRLEAREGQIMSRWREASVAILILTASSAQAQPPGQTAETVRARQLAEYNQLGILEYCQAQGAIGADIVALQRTAVAALPGPRGVAVAEAEALGRAGVVAFEASRVPIADAASGDGMPIRARCKHIAMSVQAQAGIPPVW